MFMRAIVVFGLIMFSFHPLEVLAHDYPFEPGQEKVRRLYSADNYKWKVEGRTTLLGTYQTSNAYESDVVRNRDRTRTRYKRTCATQFRLIPLRDPKSKVRTLSNDFPVDESGYFKVELVRLKCSLENADGAAHFSARRGHPNAATVKTSQQGNAGQHQRLTRQVNQFTEWFGRNYVLFARTRYSSGIYTYDGDRFDGNYAEDTGLFSGAFINFALPRGRGTRAEEWLQPIAGLQIPQPLFMGSDPVFGPNRVPAPTSEAPVSTSMLSGRLVEVKSRQVYRWQDSLNGGTGYESVQARYVLAPEPDFGFVHRADWAASIDWEKETPNVEVRRFSRDIRHSFHLEVEKEE